MCAALSSQTRCDARDADDNRLRRPHPALIPRSEGAPQNSLGRQDPPPSANFLWAPALVMYSAVTLRSFRAVRYQQIGSPAVWYDFAARELRLPLPAVS